jgi:hypothetical protein
MTAPQLFQRKYSSTVTPLLERQSEEHTPRMSLVRRMAIKTRRLELEHEVQPNVVVEWLSLLRIRKVQGPNIGPETGYPEGFRDFLVPPGKCRDSTLKIRTRPLPSKSFPNHHSLIILSFDGI